MKGRTQDTAKVSRKARHSKNKNEEAYKKSTTTQPDDFLNDFDKRLAEGRAALRRSKEARAAAQTSQTHHDKKWQERQLEELKEVKESRRQTRERMAEVHKVWMGIFSRLEAEATEAPAANHKAKTVKQPQGPTEARQRKAGRKRDDKIAKRNKEIAKVAPQARGRHHPPKPSEARARTVAKLIKELDILEPQMYGESDYERLAKENPRFLTFQVADRRGDLKEKVINIQGHQRYIRLAQELAAAKYGMKPSTIRTDWKHHKPPEFRRKLS